MKQEILHESKGILQYSGTWRLAVEVDQEISNYYRALIPYWLPANKPRWPAHITVVREEKEVPENTESWGKYEGEEIKFYYSPIVQQGKIYYWLDCYCVRLEEIRKELGLYHTSRYTRPPEGFKKCFHMTIANQKM